LLTTRGCLHHVYMKVPLVSYTHRQHLYTKFHLLN